MYLSKLEATRSDGFSIIEVLLAVAVMSIILTTAAAFYQSFQNSNETDVATYSLVQALYQAQEYSWSEVHDLGWGVNISSNNIVLFAGLNYASRNTAYDIVYNAPTAVKLTQTNEMDYTKLTGLPLTSGTFTLQGGGKSYTVSVNTKGMVDY